MMIYKKRSFLKPEEEDAFVSDKIRMLLKHSCCNSTYYPKDLMRNQRFNEQLKAHEFFCVSCQKTIHPILKVLIGDITNYKKDECKMVSPILLRMYLETKI
mmetsp:Transcript_3223/g.3146  ORF Transcript_3223/g.3146 Transcript_3223/m.3146 type:complete len:101 (+) Transcript_3223:1722-2024(+)